MDIKGKIIELLPEQNGEGKNGKWRKREYVIEIPGQYPRKVCFNLWGDKIDQFPMKAGDEVSVSFDLESRDFNGKWYTDVKAWKVEPLSKSNTSERPPLPTEPEFNPKSESDVPLPGEDDLPF
jgi:hypothetical protein